MKRRSLIVAALLYGAASACSHAGLSWEKGQQELFAEIGQNIVRTAYAFTNKGAASISVLAIKPSCGCVATSLEKLDYAPGESGQIEVTFDARMDKGISLAERSIEVTTSDAPQSPAVLRLTIHVPEAVTVSPDELVWHHGRAPKSQTVMIKAEPGLESIKLIPSAQNDNFVVRIEPEDEGRRYRLTITPKSIRVPSSATLTYTVESPALKRRVSCEISLEVH